MIFEKNNSKSKKNNQENSKSEGRGKKYFKTCELCWMLLKIKKYKLQVIIKFGKATMILVMSMKCGMWRHFKWFQEKSGRWRGSKDVIANNFFKWFYCEGYQRNVAIDGKSEMKGQPVLFFFLIIRDLMYVSLLSELVKSRKRSQPCKKEGLIKEQNPWDGRADGIQSRKVSIWLK